ncbi:hypothetical protein SAMN05443247_03113 [Bradyrhizobium erythrophlei]|nr:hypothetical protein SAMN05443247_03113 [Bradyrhizobium erythrophlei]
MMYDLPSVSDYGEATDINERKTRAAIASRDAAMTIIEISRRGPNLPKDTYIMFKNIHGNAEADARRFAHYLRSYGRIYHGEQSGKWMDEQEEMTIGRVSLALVWRHWHAVLGAREEYESIVDVTLTDRWGCDPITIVSRQKIDARIAMERAEGLYDVVLRAFEGRAPRTREQTLTLRVKPPTRPEPTPLSKIQNRRRRKLAQRNAFAGA